MHGPALDAVAHASHVVTVDMNAASENPLVNPAGHAVWHNGNFHATYVGLALDAARAALFQTAALGAARLGTLVEPAFTGLEAFAADTPASSGIMILEYVCQSAVADIRRLAARPRWAARCCPAGWRSTPASPPSRPAPAARRSSPTGPCWPANWSPRSGCCGCSGRGPAAGPLRAAFDTAAAVLDPRTTDRPLDGDLAAADGLLDGYADLLPG